MNTKRIFGLTVLVGVAFISGYATRSFNDQAGSVTSQSESLPEVATNRGEPGNSPHDPEAAARTLAEPIADDLDAALNEIDVQPALPESQWTKHPGFRRTDQQLAYEPLDPAWAARMESRIYAQVSASKIPLVTMDVLCRSTLCRVQLTHQQPRGGTEEENRQLNRELGDVIGGIVRESLPDVSGGTMTGTVDSSGRVEASVIYLFKPESAPALPVTGGTGVPAEQFRAGRSASASTGR
jgi:hypothetical protein